MMMKAKMVEWERKLKKQEMNNEIVNIRVKSG